MCVRDVEDLNRLVIEINFLAIPEKGLRRPRTRRRWRLPSAGCAHTFQYVLVSNYGCASTDVLKVARDIGTSNSDSGLSQVLIPTDVICICVRVDQVANSSSRHG